MMTKQEAMAKASKLLKLSESANANEAALAAQRAQEILTRYQIDAALLSLDDKFQEDEPIQKGETLEEGNRSISSWKLTLASHIARANFCRAYQSGASIGIIGRPSDIERVRYLYAFLSIEVDSLAKQDSKGKGRAYANSYRFGCVKAISEKLAAARAKVSEAMRCETMNEHALTRLNKALEIIKNRDSSVDAWVRANMSFRNKSSSYSGNSSAYGAGYKAGQSINMGGGQVKRLNA